MALNPTDVCGRIDQNIPKWKRELILRRRAVGRTLQVGNSSVKLTCPAVVAIVRQPDSIGTDNNAIQSCLSNEEATAASSSLNQNQEDFHPSASSSAVSLCNNMRLLDTCSDVNNLINGIDVKNKQSEVVSSDVCMDYNLLIMGEDKSVKKKSALSKSNFDHKLTNTKQQLKIKKVTIKEPNGNHSKEDDDHSDSSEELQYGPGIVNKLKSKYLSMTLREQKRIARPSIINLRRATSLENMLEDDTTQSNSCIGFNTVNKTDSKIITNQTMYIRKPILLSSHRLARNLSSQSLDTLKRARSMDTLLKSDTRKSSGKVRVEKTNKIVNNSCNQQPSSIVNENIIIVENIHHTSSGEYEKQNSLHKQSKREGSVAGELPPPDVVKQTLRIFETSPKKVRQHQSKSVSSASNVPGHIQHLASKPILSPKPVISQDKLQQTKSRVSSPKKRQNSVDSTGNNIQCGTLPDKSLNKQMKPDIITSNDVMPPKVITPLNVSPVVTVLPTNEHSLTGLESKALELINKKCSVDTSLEDSSMATSERTEIDGKDYSKPVLESALENIRRGGVTVQFSFTNEKPQSSIPKSYLPVMRGQPQALNSSLMKENVELSPPIANISPIRQVPQHTKQIGIIRPLMTRPQPSPALTEQEIEKNLINRVKSIEQPVSKVVVAIKALPESVVLGSVPSDSVTNKNLSLPRVCATSKNKSQRLWDEKIWHQNQNTIVFNFSDRKEVPDYIENDGLIIRGKRDRPKAGEGGIILLDAGAESSTDIEDPPSPCDVIFENDNILINGKSNLKRSSKAVKLRIKFNDEATTMFEYPSEASLLLQDDSSGYEASSSDERDSQASSRTSSSPNPLALGGSLGAYTPRQMGDGGWQLGVTPVQAPPSTSTNTELPQNIPPEEDHLKPAPPESTVTWSEETASDLLF